MSWHRKLPLSRILGTRSHVADRGHRDRVDESDLGGRHQLRAGPVMRRVRRRVDPFGGVGEDGHGADRPGRRATPVRQSTGSAAIVIGSAEERRGDVPEGFVRGFTRRGTSRDQKPVKGSGWTCSATLPPTGWGSSRYLIDPRSCTRRDSVAESLLP